MKRSCNPPALWSAICRGGTPMVSGGLIVLYLAALASPAGAAEVPGAAQFRQQVEPVLKEFCHDCHADGARKGGVAFDEFASEQSLLENRGLWWKALKSLRAGLMPPEKKPQPSDGQKHAIEQWIKRSVFAADPADPDPGRVTIRRLNRVEYRNTITDLLGIDFDTQTEFPPDDAGNGFDNIGDVMTLPPMLLEKYLAAARTIVARAVPSSAGVPAERVLSGRDFRAGASAASGKARPMSATPGTMSYYERASVSNTVNAAYEGRYRLFLELSANERHVENQFDYNKCRLVFRVDGGELMAKEYTREGNRVLRYEFDLQWKAGDHQLTFELEPLTPDQKQVRALNLRIDTVTLQGPLGKEHWVEPSNYRRFFPGNVPAGNAGRREYARELLGSFAQRAYRRPVDSGTVDRLVALAASTFEEPGKTFEAGIGQAMTAVLASPRFLFREEAAEPASGGQAHPLVDEYALASRLSYFFWASMPDEELMRLAGKSELRKNLKSQVNRMMADARFGNFVKNFTGQWLQTRDIDSISIDARQVLAREAAPDPDAGKRRQRSVELRNKPGDQLTAEEKRELVGLRDAFNQRNSTPLRAELTGDLRRAMRQETEMVFDYVIRGDRTLLELLDSNYTFLNERLARHYGLTNLNVLGGAMRRVTLPDESARGGVLTQGSVLAVTSNPTRTSPVKRGLFILDNILGSPPAPPPPGIPALEDVIKGTGGRTVSLREMLALHREKPLCSSCHDRMDPLGLALEHFNAMGMFRETERNKAIDATGKLLSGEEFTSVRELKKILATRHSQEFYRTLTEKLLTYALGRGLEYYDVETVDQIVARLMKEQGHSSVLFAGVVQSAPFQRTRALPAHATEIIPTSRFVPNRAEARLQP